MGTRTRPRLDEFLLAIFWVLAGLVLLYFGTTGYISNYSQILNSDNSALPRFIISFGLICFSVYGLAYAIRIFSRLSLNPPLWLDNAGPISFGVTLLIGFFFTLFTDIVLILDLFNYERDREVVAWGIITIAGLVILAIYQFLWSLNAFEPFIPWPLEFYSQESSPKRVNLLMALLLRLNSTQHAVLNHGRQGYTLEKISGPLLTEPDTRTAVANEATSGRPGLEKVMVAHGGWHASTMGFTANGTVVFAVSTGGTVHFRAGGRKGVLFPPEIKFWEFHTDKVQTASLGQPYVFLTRNFQTPAPLQNYRFIVPEGGGKFALLTPHLIRVSDWQNGSTQEFVPDEPIYLQGQKGFAPVAFNPEGSKIAWCDATGHTTSWNMQENKALPLRHYPAPDPNEVDINASKDEQRVWGLVFSPDGTKVATIGVDGVLLQNVYTGWRWFAANELSTERLTSFAFNYNGFEMAVGLNLREDKVKRPSRRSRYNGYTFRNSEQAETVEPKWLNVVRVWDLRLPDYLDLVTGEQPLREIAFSPDNQMLAAVDEAGVLWLWDIPMEGMGGRPPRLVSQVDLGITGRKTVVIFSPDMQRLICATDNRVLVFSISRLRTEAPVEQHRRVDVATAKETI